MEGLEKVIKALELCAACECRECPYHVIRFGCRPRMMLEALALLKEQLPAEAEIEGDGRSMWFFVCGECHGVIESGDHFCRNCGRRIIWEELTGAQREGREKDGNVHG